MGILQDEVAGDVGSVPRCQTCGSERVVQQAWACWNREARLWELEEIAEAPRCLACADKTELVWSRPDEPLPGRIRELNDRFRTQGLGRGSVMLTADVAGAGDEFVRAAAAAVRTFDAFTDDNDPWREHDFGAVEVAGERVFFKIDYYTPDLTAGSDNPANEGQTHRVLSIMLASEY